MLQERSNSYEKVLREKSNAIRQTERDNMHRKGRSKSLTRYPNMHMVILREALQIFKHSARR